MLICRNENKNITTVEEMKIENTITDFEMKLENEETSLSEILV